MVYVCVGIDVVVVECGVYEFLYEIGFFVCVV